MNINFKTLKLLESGISYKSACSIIGGNATIVSMNINLETFKSLEFDISYKSACSIIGGNAAIVSEDLNTVKYKWANDKRFYIEATFINDKMTRKSCCVKSSKNKPKIIVSKDLNIVKYVWANDKKNYIEATFVNDKMTSKSCSIQKMKNKSCRVKPFKNSHTFKTPTFINKKNIDCCDKRSLMREDNVDDIIREQLRDKPRWV